MKYLFVPLCASVLFLGCDDEEATPIDASVADAGSVDGGSLPDAGPTDAGQASLELEGRFTDSFGGHHVFTSTSWWNDGSNYHITQYSNDDDFFVGQNAADHPFNPDKWSRVDWAQTAGSYYYCQSAFAEESEAAALAVSRPDDSAPATTGCGGTFPWTQLIPE